MATIDRSILGALTQADSSGDIHVEPLENAGAGALATAAFGTLPGITMEAPTGSDIGIYGKFSIPQDFVGTPLLVIRGMVHEGANVLGFGFQQVPVADNETLDVAFEAEDIASATVSHAAEDMYEEIITITPSAYTAGDEVFFFFYRDDSADTQTGEFSLTGLFLRYNNA